MSTVAWIHLRVYAERSVLEELRGRLADELWEGTEITMEPAEDGEPEHLFTDTTEMDVFDRELDAVAKRHPEERIDVEYLASLPSAYHQIRSHYFGGVETVDEDSTDYIE